ncbi:MAG: rRNA pseudouridine synthase [Deltaproteobacteria bacterium]|nr:rRNA pseudouridine synthase [Deltaproteobacteria bacterium]
MPQVRLQKFLSEAGVAARRKAEVLITEGRVTVNNRVTKTLGTKVDPARDAVRVDGRVVVPHEKVYLVLNKPKGYITSVDDPQGRKTVMELLRGVAVKVAPVGRLDYYTEGVLLFTNDGDLAAGLLAPRSNVEKIYHAKFRGQVSQTDVEKLRRGVRLDNGRKTRPAKVDIIKRTDKHTWLVITLTEGQSRQIHRMAEALGHVILKLARVSFAGLPYFGLRVGEYRHLTSSEVAHLRSLAGLAPSR